MEKDLYYLDIAEATIKQGTCRKMYGAIIVKDDQIISTGYNGPPRKAKHCKVCKRIELNIAPGTMYETCRAVHAEANAIISAARKDMIGSVLYLVGKEKDTGGYVKNITCCIMCKRLIINAGIRLVVYRTSASRLADSIKTVSVEAWLNEV